MTVNDEKSVLVLDSGIGGMTVVKAIRSLSPTLRIRYISDNHYFPYGALTEDALIERAILLVGQALDRFHVDAVIIACNTASTAVLEPLRARFSVPFVGVVPPIKTASEISISRVIGLLATEGTVRRHYIDRLVEEFAPDCSVARVHCPELAPMAEDRARGFVVDRDRLKRVIAPLRDPSLTTMDVVVLGCTHYPILQEELETEFDDDVIWLNPARPVAKQLMRVLYGDVHHLPPSSTDGGGEIYFTREDRELDCMMPFLTASGFQNMTSSEIAVWR